MLTVMSAIGVKADWDDDPTVKRIVIKNSGSSGSGVVPFFLHSAVY
jgi:hypothetical protein